MKYVRKAKNTPMKGKLADDFVTEVVDKALFTKKHEALGGWDLVSDKEAKQMVNNNKALNDAFKKEKDDLKKANSLSKAERSERQKEKEAAIKEFEEFKAWKASQDK